MQNKKILFIINGLGYGGAETHLLRLSKALLDKDYQISILTISNDLSLLDKVDTRIEHINIPLRKSLKLFLDLKEILIIVKKEKPDVIHAHLFQANIISRFIKFFNRKIKVINTSHGAYLLNTRKYNPYKIYKFTKKWVDFHTVVSKDVLTLLLTSKAISKEKLIFIPNGLFVKEYTENTKKSLAFNWLAIGRFHPVKDYENLILSCIKLKSLNNNFELHIAGDGKERIKLNSLIDDNKLKNHVKLLGFVDDIPSLFNGYDGFVISSYSEGLPMVLLEAMASSLPVVSTSVGEISEITNQAKGGILVPIRDRLSLTNAMYKMMNLDKSKLLQLGSNNRKYIEDNYDIENLADTWSNLYFKQ